jgi:hypothetical protein
MALWTVSLVTKSVAVVGVADELKGQMPLAFAVVKNPDAIMGSEARARRQQNGVAPIHWAH